MRRQWLTTTTRRQSRYEHMVQVARTQLGEQIFYEAWEEGKRMSLNQLLEISNQVLLLPQQLQPEQPLRNETLPTPKPLATTALTAREMEVLSLLAQGCSSTQIARQLVISPLTVNSHVRSIYYKLGISTRA